MQSHTLELYPQRTAHVALFRNVDNAAELRKRLISQDASLTCALIDASVILEPLHVLLAVNRAVADETHQQLKSHNVYSEIVCGLSPATNVRYPYIHDT